MTTTYTTTTSTGRTATRRSDNHYVAASEDWRGNVRWHQTREAARRAAGSTGRVHDVQVAEAASPRPSRATGTCTVATHGQDRCGEAAVVSGTFGDGTAWGCCADHATPADYRAGH